jgi:DUF3040 family protein
MFSDHDRETLDEIQHQLVLDDPQFTSSFETKARRLSGSGEARSPAARPAPQPLTDDGQT